MYSFSFFFFFFYCSGHHRDLHSFPTRRCSDLILVRGDARFAFGVAAFRRHADPLQLALERLLPLRSEEHTSELQSPYDLVCRLLLEKKKKKTQTHNILQ